MLMNNQQILCQSALEQNIFKGENPLYNQQSRILNNRNIAFQNSIPLQQQYNSDVYQQNTVFQGNLYPDQRQHNNFQIRTHMSNQPMLRQNNNSLLVSEFQKNDQNLMFNLSNEKIFMPLSDQQLHNYHNNQYQQQQVQIIPSVISEDQSQNFMIGQGQVPSRLQFNYDNQCLSQQKQLLNVYSIQADPIKQYNSIIIPQLIENQIPQLNISNPQLNINSLMINSQPQISANLYQKIKNTQMTYPSSALKQQEYFMNQQIFSNNQIENMLRQTSQKTLQSLQSIDSENEQQLKQEYNIRNQNQGNSITFEIENIKNSSQIQKQMKKQINQQNQFIILKQEQQDKNNEQQNNYCLQQTNILNQKMLFDQQSNSSLPYSSQQRRINQISGQSEDIANNGDNLDQENKISQAQKNMRLSQSTYSSSSQSKTNQQTSKYRLMSEDKTNMINSSNIIQEQASSLQVYVDSRKRGTSIDHSFYTQLGNLLQDKSIVKEFSNIILNSGMGGLTQDQQINQQNNINQINTDNSDLIKKYKQLLNQTFFEIKHLQNPGQQQKEVSNTIQNGTQIIKLEDNGINDESDNFIEQISLNQKYQEKTIQANSIVESIQQAILTKVPSLFKEDDILNSIKLTPSGQYQVYSNLQNMCNQFVRGEKRKRFKERNKDSLYMSRFHNLNRLFFYQIMSMYSYESLSCFQIDPTISEKMRNVISFIKIHSKLQLINNQKPKKSEEEVTKNQKSKRSQSEREELISSSLSITQKQQKNENEGKRIINDQSDNKTSKKKSQKISIKQNQKDERQLLNEQDLISSQVSSIQIKSRSNKKKLSQFQDSVSISISQTESTGQTRNRTSTIEENMNQQSEKKHENLQINEGETIQHLSQTPSPALKSMKEDYTNQFQETQKKQSLNQLQNFFSISNNKKFQYPEASFDEKIQNEDGQDDDSSSEDEMLEEEDDDENADFPIKNYNKYYRTLKVENYTHSHYNTLFLKLSPQSIEHLSKQSKDIDSHWLAYKIDLRNPSQIPPEKIQYVNIMKSLFYKIFMHFNNINFSSKQQEQERILNDISNDPSQPIPRDSVEFKSTELRLDYYLRVVQGIQKLNQGIYSHKF